MGDGVRLQMSLADYMQLNLVHRRLTRLADGDAFVHPDDLKELVGVLERVFGADAYSLRDMINSMRRGGHAGTP